MTNQVGIDMNNDADGDDLLQYNPNRLLDTLIENLRLKNDAALSRALEVAPPVISTIRHHRLPVGASLLIRMTLLVSERTSCSVPSPARPK